MTREDFLGLLFLLACLSVLITWQLVIDIWRDIREIWRKRGKREL